MEGTMMAWHPDMPEEYRNQIVTGDARELARRIPDESVDLIFTDPPYPKDFIPLYSWLAETGARILKPGGLCIALAGHAHIPDIIPLMSEHLKFYWIGGMLHGLGTTARIYSRQFMCGWKPMLWYSKGKVPDHAWIFDLLPPSPTRDKRYHKWGQAISWARYYIDKLTEIIAIVFDPLTGGGTVPAVCKMLGRNYVAFEIDPDTADKARERVLNTQPPLFVLEPEQMELSL
jgi:DNA modification methylase